MHSALNTFNSLLDCARASSDQADFERRLTIEGLLSKHARQHAALIRGIIHETDENAPSDEDFWRFLRVLHVVSFDLNTATAQQLS